MSENLELSVLLLRGLIASLSEDEQRQCMECVGMIRAIVGEYGDQGKVAALLVGAEIQAEQTGGAGCQERLF